VFGYEYSISSKGSSFIYLFICTGFSFLLELGYV